MAFENRTPTLLAPRVRLWLLRLLVRGGAHEALRGKAQYDVNVLAAIGYPRARTAPALRRLEADLASAEATPPPCDSLIERNVAALADKLGFSEVERDVLVFAITSRMCSDINDCVFPMRRRESVSAAWITATALGYPLAEVARALSPDGPLASTRLAVPANGHRPGFFDVPDQVTTLLSTDDVAPDALTTEWVRPAPPAALGLEAFAHLGADLDLTCRLLRGALAERAKGVHVFLHGPPGTGKTALSRVLAAAAGAEAHEVVASKRDGSWTGGTARLTTFATAEILLSGHDRAVLVMDEAEDVFPSLRAGDAQPADKAWVHRLLEGSRVPAIWISNSIEGLDPAHLRRFAIVLEVPVPPVAVRRRLVSAAVHGLAVGGDFVARVAADPRVAPAHVEQAARVVKLAQLSDVSEIERTVVRVVQQALPGRHAHHAPCAPRAVGAYDLSAVRADVDLDRLVAALTRRPVGTICLHGAPGTGKTAFAHHLAERIGVPLQLERASDLLDKFLGETEKRIAAMFRRARADHALLLLDEADSFLRSRTSAERSWEVTQVNELLVQMEQFDGLFVCATNLLESIDAAALRRFGVKIAFGYPGADARWGLFHRALEASGGSLPDGADAQAAARVRLDAMDRLTPGDFAAVIARAAMLDDRYDAPRLLDVLAAELAVKPGSSGRKVGFRS